MSNLVTRRSLWSWLFVYL